LAARVLEQEHIVYPLAVRWFVEGHLRLENGRVRLNAPRPAPAALISP
jgi:phosphoribosylglycinamide formyltransferase-1